MSYPELQETNEYIRKLIKSNGGKVTSVACDNSYLDCEIDLQHPSFNSMRHTYKVFLRINIEAVFGVECICHPDRWRREEIKQ